MANRNCQSRCKLSHKNYFEANPVCFHVGVQTPPYPGERSLDKRVNGGPTKETSES